MTSRDEYLGDSPALHQMIVSAEIPGITGGDHFWAHTMERSYSYEPVTGAYYVWADGAIVDEAVPASIRQAVESWIERRIGPYYGAPGHTTDLLRIDDHTRALGISLTSTVEGIDYRLDLAQRQVVLENIARLTELLALDDQRYRCKTCHGIDTEHAFDSCAGGPDGWEPVP